MFKEAPSICLVTSELHPLFRNGGIGTYYHLVAHLLAKNGWKVHILYSHPHKLESTLMNTCRQQLAKANISISFLQEFDTGSKPVENPHWWVPHQSERVRAALVPLHEKHRFDLIEFPEYQGLGFRAVQAKRSGLAFSDTQLIVKLHSSHQWCREAGREPIYFLHELLTNYCERYAFDHADVQQSPCQYMLDYATSINWQVRSEARVVANPFETPSRRLPPEHAHTIDELVFFGRLEARKGLDLFLAAAKGLPEQYAITFLGRSIPLESGQDSGEFARQSLPHHRVKVLTHLDRQGAIDYLMSRRCVAVIPSLLENFPNTVIECLTHGIPFVANRVGGIPEIVTDPELKASLLAQPNIGDLRRVLTDYLSAEPETRVRWQKLAADQTNIEEHDRVIVDEYQSLLSREEEIPNGFRLPRVTVAWAVDPGAEICAESLSSLLKQSYTNFELIVVSDSHRGLPSDARLRHLEQAEPDLASAWNRALHLSSDDYFIPISSNQIAHPQLLETFVRGLENNPAAALVCYSETPKSRQQPTSGPWAFAGLENVFGSGVAAFHTRALHEAGGFVNAADHAQIHWQTLLRIQSLEAAVDVIPASLVKSRPASAPAVSHKFNSGYAAHLPVLKAAARVPLPIGAESENLWLALTASYYREKELVQLRARQEALEHHAQHFEQLYVEASRQLGWYRYRVTDWLHRQVKRVPLALPLLRHSADAVSRPYRWLRSLRFGTRLTSRV